MFSVSFKLYHDAVKFKGIYNIVLSLMAIISVHQWLITAFWGLTLFPLSAQLPEALQGDETQSPEELV